MVKKLDELPTYDELPNKHRYWEWGPAGSHEEGLGKQNLLTPKHVAEGARSEIITGERVGLGWEMHKMEFPSFGRKKFEWKMNPGPTHIDDEYNLNPQASSQWDGFRHYPQPLKFSDKAEEREKYEKDPTGTDGIWLGGTTREEILKEGSSRIGIQHWAEQGIVGRGVLIDYATYAEEKGIKYSCFEENTITRQDLQNVIDRYKVKIQPADIVFIRIGLTKEWDSYTEEQKKVIGSRPPEFMGLDPSEDNLRWVWDNHFPAVASDAVALEMFPSGVFNLPMHEHLLAGWGVAIGEILNLEPLSALCRKLNRYSFFVSSVPFNAVGGVSSPPNAVAIF